MPALLLGRQGRVGKEAEVAEPVIEAHQYDAIACKGTAVVLRRRAAAVDETATVDPHHDRQVLRSGLRRLPDIQIQAILCRRDAQRCSISGKRDLHAVSPVVNGLPHALPGHDGLRRPPTIRPYGRRREWDPLKSNHALIRASFDEASGDSNSRRGHVVLR